MPPPKRVGGSFLGRIGHYSRPILRQILKTGQKAAINRLRSFANSKIKNGGDLLTKIATSGVKRKGGRGRGAVMQKRRKKRNKTTHHLTKVISRDVNLRGGRKIKSKTIKAKKKRGGRKKPKGKKFKGGKALKGGKGKKFKGGKVLKGGKVHKGGKVLKGGKGKKRARGKPHKSFPTVFDHL